MTIIASMLNHSFLRDISLSENNCTPIRKEANAALYNNTCCYYYNFINFLLDNRPHIRGIRGRFYKNQTASQKPPSNGSSTFNSSIQLTNSAQPSHNSSNSTHPSNSPITQLIHPTHPSNSVHPSSIILQYTQT